jgi:hypothetical protein
VGFFSAALGGIVTDLGDVRNKLTRY